MNKFTEVDGQLVTMGTAMDLEKANERIEELLKMKEQAAHSKAGLLKHIEARFTHRLSGIDTELSELQVWTAKQK